MGKKIIDFETQCEASQGRKSKARGGESKVTQFYTPLNKHQLQDKIKPKTISYIRDNKTTTPFFDFDF